MTGIIFLRGFPFTGSRVNYKSMLHNNSPIIIQLKKCKMQILFKVKIQLTFNHAVIYLTPFIRFSAEGLFKKSPTGLLCCTTNRAFSEITLPIDRIKSSTSFCDSILSP